MVLEWLHPGCDGDLSADFRNFPFKILFKKCFKIVFLSLWRRDPVLELQFPRPCTYFYCVLHLQIAL